MKISCAKSRQPETFSHKRVSRVHLNDYHNKSYLGSSQLLTLGPSQLDLGSTLTGYWL